MFLPESLMLAHLMNTFMAQVLFFFLLGPLLPGYRCCWVKFSTIVCLCDSFVSFRFVFFSSFRERCLAKNMQTLLYGYCLMSCGFGVSVCVLVRVASLHFISFFQPFFTIFYHFLPFVLFPI